MHTRYFNSIPDLYSVWQLVNQYIISCVIPAICFECLVVLKGARKQRHWRPAKTPWGMFKIGVQSYDHIIMSLTNYLIRYYFYKLMLNYFSWNSRRQVQTPSRPARSLGNLPRVLRRGMCLLTCDFCICKHSEKIEWLSLKTTSFVSTRK